LTEEAEVKVGLEREFNENELSAIANHLAKKTVSHDDVYAFMEKAIKDAVGLATVELEVFENDPSTNVGA
jgi:hypothetical protein